MDGLKWTDWWMDGDGFARKDEFVTTKFMNLPLVARRNKTWKTSLNLVLMSSILLICRGLVNTAHVHVFLHKSLQVPNHVTASGHKT